MPVGILLVDADLFNEKTPQVRDLRGLNCSIERLNLRLALPRNDNRNTDESRMNRAESLEIAS